MSDALRQMVERAKAATAVQEGASVNQASTASAPFPGGDSLKARVTASRDHHIEQAAKCADILIVLDGPDGSTIELAMEALRGHIYF